MSKLFFATGYLLFALSWRLVFIIVLRTLLNIVGSILVHRFIS